MKIQNAEFIAGANEISNIPKYNYNEVAFTGRSNVGKSSLINTIVHRKNLAKVSANPGKTKQINLFLVDSTFILADLPGFGYAAVSKTERQSWKDMIYDYFTKREKLKLICCLVDSRHDPLDTDLALIEWLENNNTEKAIRQIITKLYEDVEWDWYSKNNSGVLYWHWSPNYAWQMNFPLRGYNEAMIVYLLAIASPTHSVPASYYHNGWAAANNYKNGNTWFGYKLFVGPAYGGPLFFAHYSFLGFDPRGIKDKYTNYFDNNRNHTLINRGWCIYNPLKHKKYSENSWGLTASDNPFGYSAHEPGSRDNGTIAPTAALSSMPYTPTESIAALRHFYFVEGESLFGPNGFYDAFNGDQNWVADSYLAIDQGPILVMLQNHRTELLWNMFMKNPEIKPALDAIGFVPDLTATSEANDINKMALYPNPTTGKVKLVFDRERPNQIIIFDNTGNIVKNFKRMVEIESLDEIELIPSLYFIQANFEGNKMILKFIELQNENNPEDTAFYIETYERQ